MYMSEKKRYNVAIYLTPQEHAIWKEITAIVGESSSSLGATLLRAHMARDKYLLDRKTFRSEYGPYIRKGSTDAPTT